MTKKLEGLFVIFVIYLFIYLLVEMHQIRITAQLLLNLLHKAGH